MIPGHMRRSDTHPALTDEVERFQAEVSRLAFDAVREIVRQELDRRRAQQPKPSRGRRRAAAASSPPATQAAQAPAAPSPRPSPASAVPGKGKRAQWTRETVTDELTNWMLGGASSDAAFVKRHGPPGLVAAARRIFGRFEAALNVAAINISKLYPEGPPKRQQP